MLLLRTAVPPASGTACIRAGLVLFALACSARAAQPFAPFEAGRNEYAAGEFKKAAKHFEQAVKADPADAEAHLWLGRCWEVLADITAPFQAAGPARRARLHLSMAVQLAPDRRDYRRELIDLLLDSAYASQSALQEAERLLAAMPEADADRFWFADRLREVRASRSSPGQRAGIFLFLFPQRLNRLVSLPVSSSVRY